jgi:hypothetical protein
MSEAGVLAYSSIVCNANMAAICNSNMLSTCSGNGVLETVDRSQKLQEYDGQLRISVFVGFSRGSIIMLRELSRGSTEQNTAL